MGNKKIISSVLDGCSTCKVLKSQREGKGEEEIFKRGVFFFFLTLLSSLLTFLTINQLIVRWLFDGLSFIICDIYSFNDKYNLCVKKEVKFRLAFWLYQKELAVFIAWWWSSSFVDADVTIKSCFHESTFSLLNRTTH